MTNGSQALHEMRAAAVAQDKPAPPQGQPTTPERLIEADAARREKERLQRRGEIRAKIKQQSALMKQVDDLESQLRLLDQRADEAADTHARATEPIQTKLATCAGTARDKLLSQLTECNITLERELDTIARVRNPLIKKHREVRSEAASLPAPQRLGGKDLACPRLLAEAFACERRLQAAIGRVEIARQQLSVIEPALALAKSSKVPRVNNGWVVQGSRPSIDLESVHVLSQRVARWKCEMVHAESEQFEASAELARLGAEMIDE